MNETPQQKLDRIIKEHESGLKTVHPSVLHVVRLFKYDHLPPRLQDVSKRFCLLATQIAESAQTPEATVALRKLLEAKDAAVRDHGFARPGV